jgi:hypothetical protein
MVSPSGSSSLASTPAAPLTASVPSEATEYVSDVATGAAFVTMIVTVAVELTTPSPAL